ncbi:MAG TPA: hypothetical protein PKH82_10160 [Thermotogota bacterium]|nr:hypothetical protein [Thermotogota bacterium]HNR64462.1 hypothetical protein [Thermotogota bacterium]HQQ66527.1 hypothetical protein [Thermotogota bacterium]
MKKILIRTHGGKRVGLGHLMRCLSIAKGLRRFAQTTRFDVEWIVNEEIIPFIESEGFPVTRSERFSTEEETLFLLNRPDGILFDAYGAGNPYLTFLKSKAKTVIVIDDNNDQYASRDVDAVVNGNIHAERLSYNESFPQAQRWVGPAFLAMKEEYWESEEIGAPIPGSVMVTVGGADPLHLMESLARALEPYPHRKTLIIGPAFEKSETERLKESFTEGYDLVFSPRSLKPLIQRSEVVLTASGSTVYEVLRLNRLPILFELAENQRQIACILEESGIPNLGWYTHLSSARIHQAILDTVQNKGRLYEKCRALFPIFDGQGVPRIVEKIEALIA